MINQNQLIRSLYIESFQESMHPTCLPLKITLATTMTSGLSKMGASTLYFMRMFSQYQYFLKNSLLEIWNLVPSINLKISLLVPIEVDHKKNWVGRLRQLLE